MVAEEKQIHKIPEGVLKTWAQEKTLASHLWI